MLAIIVALTAGCSSKGTSSPPASGPSSTTTTSATPDADQPRGVVAIGHSSLTGLSADVARPQENSPKDSWATGTNPAVNSIYLRLAKVRPDTDGAVANTAENGAKAATLKGQAEDALAQVPFPTLAIVQTIDNDIRCDGTDDAHLAEFRTSVRAALDTIHAASPRTTIIVVSNFGSPAGYAKAVAGDPVAVAGFTGTDPCAPFLADGKINAKGVATLSAIIDKYEAEQLAACAEVPLCHGDDGALGGFTERLETLASDRQHLLSTGHAELAGLLWPTVEKVLALR
jgi:hypothetical protein